jgi:hypothetical protein
MSPRCSDNLGRAEESRLLRSDHARARRARTTTTTTTATTTNLLATVAPAPRTVSMVVRKRSSCSRPTRVMRSLGFLAQIQHSLFSCTSGTNVHAKNTVGLACRRLFRFQLLEQLQSQGRPTPTVHPSTPTPDNARAAHIHATPFSWGSAPTQRFRQLRKNIRS